MRTDPDSRTAECAFPHEFPKPSANHHIKSVVVDIAMSISVPLGGAEGVVDINSDSPRVVG